MKKEITCRKSTCKHNGELTCWLKKVNISVNGNCMSYEVDSRHIKSQGKESE